LCFYLSLFPETIDEPVFVALGSPIFLSLPIIRPLGIDNIPAIFPSGKLDKNKFQPPNDPEAIKNISSLAIIDDKDPDQVHMIPFESEVTKQLSPNDIVNSALAPYLGKAMTKTIRDEFIRENLPTRVQVAMEQTFGKDSCSQSFHSEVTFRHTIPYLYNLGWLSKRDRAKLEAAWPMAKRYAILWKKHRHVDFSRARAGQTQQPSTTNGNK
jgi:hypothetical protein